MAIIRVPDVMKPRLDINLKAPVLVDGNLEYEVSLEMKQFWESLSEREKETLCSISSKEKKDLRDVLAEQM